MSCLSLRLFLFNNKRLLRININKVLTFKIHNLVFRSNNLINVQRIAQRYINTINDNGKPSSIQDQKYNLLTDLDLWTPIYKFNKLTLARMVQKAKLIQTIFTVIIAIPTATASLDNSIILSGCLFMSALACGMLYIMGTFFSRLACIIYVSKEDPTKMRVAQLTFFGKRQDAVYNKDDFVPISDLPDSPSEIYIILKRYSDENYKLYLTFPYGNILDKKEFEQIFGEVFVKPK